MSSTLNWLMDSSDGPQHSVLLTLFRITFILTVAWLCHSACSRWNPRLRILLWRTTAIGLISVFGLSQIPYRLNLALLPVTANSTLAKEAGHVNGHRKTVPSADVPVPLSHSRLEEGESSDSALTQMAAPRFTQEATSTPEVMPDNGKRNTSVDSRLPTASKTSNYNLSLYGYFVTAWAIGIIFISSGWFGGVLRLASLYRRAVMVPADIHDLALEISATIGYLGPIDVRCSDEIQTPFIVGSWRPRVLIPAHQCADTERQELQASLAHEFAHCQGKDLRWNHLLTLIQILLWFHPLAWRIRVAHADACDELCDAKAAGYLGDGKLYGAWHCELLIRTGRLPWLWPVGHKYENVSKRWGVT